MDGRKSTHVMLRYPVDAPSSGSLSRWQARRTVDDELHHHPATTTCTLPSRRPPTPVTATIGATAKHATVAPFDASDHANPSGNEGIRTMKAAWPRSTTPMHNAKFWLKALRIAAAVLAMVAQVIAACVG